MIEIGSKVFSVIVVLIFMIVGIMALATLSDTQDNLIDQDETTTTITNYVEDFEDDTNNTNPTDTWYTYNESGWDWANASEDNTQAHTGNFSYRINDTDGDSNWSDFNFISQDYDYTKFWFKVNSFYHNETNLSFRKANEVPMCYINITNDTITFENQSTIGWTTNITNMSWYGVRLDFNYTTDEIRGRLYNRLGVVLNDTWIGMYDGSEDFQEVSHFNISGVATEQSRIWIDNWDVYDSDTATSLNGRAPDYDTMDTLESLYPILGIIIIVSALFFIIGMMYVFKK